MNHVELEAAPSQTDSFGGAVCPAGDLAECEGAGHPSGGDSTAAASSGVVVDSLAFGVAFMLGVNIVQRLVGLIRNVLVCRMMAPDELGRWNLAFSFLLFAAPLAVLGLPGVFGRYVEYYRHRGALKIFLRRILFTTMAAAVIAIGLISAAPAEIAHLVFNDAGQAQLIRTSLAVLALVIAFNFLSELLTALRQVRLVSIMQFTHSAVFALAAVSMLWLTAWGAEAVIAAYAFGCLAALVLAMPFAGLLWSKLPHESENYPAKAMWRKLIPFAAWMWATNILSNLYHAADRYMLVHFASANADEAAGLVGQYHSSLVAPELMLAAAALLAGIMLPYMANCWESGDRQSVWRQLLLALKLAALGFTAGGAILLLAAPLLFNVVLAGKYHGGMTAMPLTLLYCIWTGLLSIATAYLWCRERPVLASAAILAGVIVNIVMNAWLVPLYGLMGAVLGTAIANAAALCLTYYFCIRLEMPSPRSLWLASAAPLLLLAGPVASLIMAAAIAMIAWRSEWLFDREEKTTIARELQSLAHRLPFLAR